jgi:hypothetical protein
MRMDLRLYIFVLWENGRNKEKFLFDELKKKFIIQDIFEITWSEQNFVNNMRRFYGPKLGDASKKTTNCGMGPFLLILISDPHPRFAKRRTSNGMELVNINLYDNKKIYRKLTGTGYAIHSSVTDKETNDDLTLLLGKNTQDLAKEISKKWDGSIKKLELDLIGQDGWKDLKQLLYVLNSTTNYVILRNFEDFPDKFLLYKHNDIDILTDDFLRIPYIANGGKSPFNDVFSPLVKIGDKTIPIDFEYPGYNYYDEKLSKDILKRRILYNGFYTPSKEDYFYTLFYHAIFHQKKISDEYKTKLRNLATELVISEITQYTFDDIDKSKEFLEKYMSRMGYLHTNSTQYKIRHNEFSRLVKVAIYLWRTQGIDFLLTAIKGKIKRTISKI